MSARGAITFFGLAMPAPAWQNTTMPRALFSLRFFLMACLVGTLFMGCQQQGPYKRPPVVKFHSVKGPIVPRSTNQLAREANIRMRIMPSNSPQRRRASRMRPRFITIHSTANHSCTATGMQHSRALCRGAFTNRNWHFSVDQYMVTQNLPPTETAWHAGSTAGNRTSIGIEMCEAENKGHNHFRTWDRAAKLTAVLMKRYGISLRHVVPHYHWTRKNCPAPLLSNGKPGPKWAWFISRVDYYYRCINNGQSFR